MTTTDASARIVQALGPYQDGIWYPAERWAEDLGISRQTLLNRRASGAPGPLGTIIHGRLFFAGEDLNAWLRAQREES